MIHDLDETLRELLVTTVPIDPLAVDITFTMPGKDWATAITKPTVSLFLYDIRENAELRGNERLRASISPTSSRSGRATWPTSTGSSATCCVRCSAAR